MRKDIIIGLEREDIVVDAGVLDSALANLWGNEAFRSQIMQVALKAFKDKQFQPQKIEWEIGDKGYVLSIIVRQALRGLVEQAIKEEVIPFIRNKASAHRDFKPVS